MARQVRGTLTGGKYYKSIAHSTDSTIGLVYIVYWASSPLNTERFSSDYALWNRLRYSTLNRTCVGDVHRIDFWFCILESSRALQASSSRDRCSMHCRACSLFSTSTCEERDMRGVEHSRAGPAEQDAGRGAHSAEVRADDIICTLQRGVCRINEHGQLSIPPTHANSTSAHRSPSQAPVCHRSLASSLPSHTHRPSPLSILISWQLVINPEQLILEVLQS